MRPFLLGVARNLALKRWRDAHRRTDLDEELAAAQFEAGLAHDASGAIERGEIAAIVGRAVRALPPLQREALILSE